MCCVQYNFCDMLHIVVGFCCIFTYFVSVECPCALPYDKLPLALQSPGMMCPPTVLCLVLCAQAASDIAFSTAMVLRSHSLYWSSMRMGSLCKVQSCVVHSWIGVVCMRMLVCVFELVYIIYVDVYPNVYTKCY